jgi:hypothetical protein
MHRVKLNCNDAEGNMPHAPFLGGTLKLGTLEAPILFLVDTGADHTLIDASHFHIPSGTLKTGTRNHANGVGGNWPTRVFLNKFRFELLVEEADTGDEVVVDVPLPRVDAMVPFAEIIPEAPPEEILGPIAPTDRRVRRGTVLQSPVISPLLGRDVFFQNYLRLNFDPRGDSYIYFSQKVE